MKTLKDKRKIPVTIDCNVPDKDMTEEQVDITIKLLEEAEKQGLRVTNIIFAC